MTLDELKRIVAGGESESVEFKRSTGQRSRAAETVCGMLNGLGGFVVFGVSDNGELVGQELGQRTVEDVTNELARIEPPAFPEVETVALGPDHAAVVLRVPGSRGLYNYKGRYYQRVGPTTRPMPSHEVQCRAVERLHATRRWENEPVAEGVTIADLDSEEIRRTLSNAISLGRLDGAEDQDIESILRGLKLIHEGKLLNAAVALYGQSQRRHVLYPQMGIRLGRFRGVNRLADFTDNRQYLGTRVRPAPPRRDVPARPRAHSRACRVGQDAARRPTALSAPSDA